MKDIKTYYIHTYGCVMNYSDSDRIRYVLNNIKMEEVDDPLSADLVILNSCSVRKQAEDKIGGWFTRFQKHKKEIPLVILTGCMAVRKQRGNQAWFEKYPAHLKKKYPWISFFVDIQDIQRIPELLGKNSSEMYASYLDILPPADGKVVANIPISTGCNFFCSYCIVPFSRGQVMDRSFKDILNEVELSIKFGAKLITLIGQNVNSWKGIDGQKKLDFADLLNAVSNLEGDFWINFLSSNPMDFSERMIKVISESNKIMKWINLAVQSGSDDVLQRMNRRYSVMEYIQLVDNIKRYIPDIRLTTDMIVGFPGETESDFEKSKELVTKVGFDMVYLGKYSPRKGSLSFKMEDNVTQKVKKEREIVIRDLVNEIRDTHHFEFVGKEIIALVTGGRKALSFYNHEIIIDKVVPEEKIGSFISVKVVGSSLSGLVAKAS